MTTTKEQIQYMQASFSPFSEALMRDPHYLTTVRMTPYIRLENSRVSGGKLWEGRASDANLVISWGKLQGTHWQKRTFQKDECVSSNPVMELMNRAAKKIKEGYHLVSCRTI